MPDLDPQLVYEVFAAVQELPEVDREHYLENCSREQPQLVDAVRKLLEKSEHALGFLDVSGQHLGLEKNLSSHAAASGERFFEPKINGQLISEHPRIGPYKLLEVIGEGGMGIVYLAEQTSPVRRKVALKVIKPGMDSRQVIARFEAERQALALMNHQHIARVFDGGTTEDGRPYFAMELVRGIPITEYCDQQKLPTTARIELLCDVCEAVQHAHQKGIIHRDLKPSNILITQSDRGPMAKVIDFGIAKALAQQLTEKTLYTGFQHFVGTPLYMSPEQVELRSHDVDTRSDVYSLGVLLYELLSGLLPFDRDTVENSGLDEFRRILREHDPLRPSVRVNTLQQNALSTISHHRRIDQRKLSQSLQGELDWIIMKALEKDRTRRYQSPQELQDDLQRHLDGERVLACAPTLTYRMRKWIRKNRVGLITSSVVLVALLIGLSVAVSQAVRATKAETEAKDNLAQTISRNRQIEEMLYANEMRSAFQAYFDGNFDRVNQVLDRYREADETTFQPGLEWNILNNLEHVPSQKIFQADAKIRFVHWDQGLGLAVIGDASGVISLVDPFDSNLRASFPTPHGEVLACLTTPDGKLLSCGIDGRLTKWTISRTASDISLTQDRNAQVSSRPLMSIAHDERSKRIYVAGRENCVFALDSETLEIKQRSETFGRRIECLHVLNDGGVVAGIYDGNICLLDSLSLHRKETFDAGYHMGGYNDFSVDNNEQFLAASQLTGQVVVINSFPSAELQFKFLFPADLHSLAMSPDGRWLVGGDSRGRLHLIPLFIELGQGFLDNESAIRQRMRSWNPHDTKVEAVFFVQSPEKQTVCLSAERSGAVMLTSPLSTDSQKLHHISVNDLTFLANELLLSAGDDITLWDVEPDPHPIWSLDKSGFWSNIQFLVETGDVFLTHNRNEIFRSTFRSEDPVRLDGLELILKSPEQEFIQNWTISPDGRYLTVDYQNIADGQHRIELRDLQNRRNIMIAPAALANDMKYSSDSRVLAIVQDNDVVLLDSEDGTERLRLVGHKDTVTQFAFSNNDRTICSVSHDGSLICWDTDSGDRLWRVEAHDNRAITVAFHPLKATIATVGLDASLRLWNSNSHVDREFRLVGELPLNAGHPSRLSFSPDGAILAIRFGSGPFALIDCSEDRSR